MVPYDKMYARLFNAITDALPLILDDPLLARQLLKKAQQDTEELYLSQDE